MFSYFFEFMFQVVYVEVIIKFWLVTTFLNKSHTTMGEKTLKHSTIQRGRLAPQYTQKHANFRFQRGEKALSWINFRFLTKNMQIYVYSSF